MRRRQRWVTSPEQPDLVQQLSQRHQVPELIARILLNRGLARSQEVASFLDPALGQLLPPADMRDLPEAADCLARALARRDPVAVYGDYDVDGLTATALLRHFLESLGARVVSYIPNRLTQGYGLHPGAVTELAKKAKVLVTVDCGISNAAEVALARKLGMAVIVTDHHEPPEELPPALAVVNPKRRDCGYAFKELAGVGVALNLALGLRACLRDQGWFVNRPEPDIRDYLDLVALGTAADVAPLTGVNRILVSRGLQVLGDNRRLGIQALREVAGLPTGMMSLRDVVFRLAPRLNAAGRLGHSRAALELLLTEDRDRARRLAQELNRLNQERQALGEAILKAAVAQVQVEGLQDRPALVLAGEDWHPGIIGIVAAKLVELYHRPVALLSRVDGLGRGSARSVEAFDLYAGLTACTEHLVQYGGHPAAAGFTLDLADLAAFREAFEAVALARLGREPQPPALTVDAEITLPQLDGNFFFHLNRLRPFGQGNPPPVLACLQARIIDSWVVGNNHLKLKLAQEGRVMTAIAFDQASLHPLRGSYDVAFNPRLNLYQNCNHPELLVLDLGSAEV
ncbi:MAG: single-stranded-DNA-specific exonuclease RecJ [Deltaproteobacteria bacterium]|nr:single-stranded-DNA-specific exonuclease RecJ [Deltaproteobacteria bacterium]